MAQRYAKVRKDDIHFKKSLFRFCFLFSIILFLGLISLRLIKSIDLKERVLNEIKSNDDFIIDIGTPTIKLSQGVMPVFGIAFDRVEVKQKKCSSRRIVAQDALLVINPWRLLRGQLKFGWASFSHIEVDYQKRCKSLEFANNLQKKTVFASVPPANHSKSYEEGFKSFFSKINRVLSASRLTYLIVDTILVRVLSGADEDLLIKAGMSARIKEIVKVELKIYQVEAKGVQLPLNSATIGLELGDKLIGSSLEMKVREGLVNLNLKIENSKSFNSSLNLKLKKLPMSAVSQYFSEKSQVNYLWANCSVSASGPIDRVQESPLKVSDCNLVGPYGNAEVLRLKGDMSGISLVDVKFKDLKLNKILTERRAMPFSGVLSDFGSLSGQAQYINGDVSASGEFTDVEVVFSNNDLRDVQKLRKVPFFINGSEERIQLELNNVELVDGEFAGEVQFQYEPIKRNGHGKLKIDRLVFNPKIYQLMVRAEPSLLKVYGKFLLKDGKVKDWSAFLLAPQVKSEDYRLNNLKVKGEGRVSEASLIRVSAASGSVDKKSKVFEWLEPTMIDSNASKDDVGFNELSVKLKLFSDKRLAWQRGYLRLKNGWQLSTEGGVSVQENISGWLQWDRPELPQALWGVDGIFFDSHWTPKSPWLKQWLSDHPDFVLAHSSIQFERADKGGFGKRLEQVGKKAIDKVKSVLKPKGK